VLLELLDAPWLQDGEKKISLSVAANASQAYGNGTAKSGEPFFRGFDSDIIQRQRPSWRTLNSQPAKRGLLQQSINSNGGYSSQDRFLIHRGRWAPSTTLAHALLSN